ncbi:MAG: metal-dependent transcriptional regulator [Candidatus Thorarchaeota archaeon]
MTANDSIIPITSTIEDYLEGILVLSEEKGFAQVTELAHLLEVSKASVTEMVSKMKKLELVNFEKYGTISLTQKGKEIATKVFDMHETLKSFLLMIGVKESNANQDCCSMEHDLSKDTIKRLKTFIEFLEDEKQRDIIERFAKYKSKS